MKLFYGAILIFLFGISACQAQSTNKAVDAKTFDAQIKATKDPVILDVRTPEEYAAGYIPNAVNVDYYSDDFEARIAQLNKENTYFVYCLAGGRSKSAADMMREKGFVKVVDLKGGITEWQNNLLPLAKPPK